MRHYGAGESRPTRRLVSALRSRPASRLRSRTGAWLLTLAAVAVWLGAAAPGAFAAPDITLDKQAPRAVLLGEDSPVTLHVTNPTGQPYGYNLSFRDVLPAGVSYVPGSAPVAPRILPNAPAAGQTTLIFENVSDLSPGSAYDLGYQVRHDPAVLGVGDTYTNQAGAYINTDPRFVPDFGANGAPTGDFTGSATDDATTAINAIEIEKDEPSPEGELLRGVTTTRPSTRSPYATTRSSRRRASTSRTGCPPASSSSAAAPMTTRRTPRPTPPAPRTSTPAPAC